MFTYRHYFYLILLSLSTAGLLALDGSAKTPTQDSSDVMIQAEIKFDDSEDETDRPSWASHCALSEAEVEESWLVAVSKAKEAFAKHASRIKNKDLVVVINYDTLVFDESNKADHGDRMRVYDASKNWSLVRRDWVSHAYASGPNCLKRFSNVPNSLISSRGAFITHKKPHRSPSFGYPALMVHGLEKGVNDRVLSRAIIFHQAIYGDMPIDYSHGCFMTRPAVNKDLLPSIAGGRFVYVHSSVPSSN